MVDTWANQFHEGGDQRKILVGADDASHHSRDG
jgi:hypothetical protein